MTQDRQDSKSPVSRRSMLLTSGAVVAAGALATGSATAANAGSEPKYWRNLIGETFTVDGAVNTTTRIRLDLTLVGVEETKSADPNRPEKCRKPFTLFFLPAKSRQPLEGATYYLNNQLTGRLPVFINETLNQRYSDRPVVQAVFG